MIVNANSIVQNVIQNKNGIIELVNVIVKIIVKCQKDYRYDPSVGISENSKYLKSIDDVSVIECGEAITGMGIVSIIKTNTVATEKINTITTNAMSTASINCVSKKDCYILHTVLLVIINDHITIDNYYYFLFSIIIQSKKVQYKRENNEF